MTKDERREISEALRCLNLALNIETLEYDVSGVLLAHRALRRIDLTPPAPRKPKDG